MRAKTTGTPPRWAMTSPASAGPTARDRLTLTRSSREAARSCALGPIRGWSPPAGQLHRDAGAQREGAGEQQGRRHLPGGGERGDQEADDEEVDLDGEQQPAPIEGVGQDAPGSASSITGSVLAVGTRATIAAALGASMSSHCAPTVCIQVPMLLISTPSHSQRKARRRRRPRRGVGRRRPRTGPSRGRRPPRPASPPCGISPPSTHRTPVTVSPVMRHRPSGAECGRRTGGRGAKNVREHLLAHSAAGQSPGARGAGPRAPRSARRRPRRLTSALLRTDDGMRYIRLFQVGDLVPGQLDGQRADSRFQVRGRRRPDDRRHRRLLQQPGQRDMRARNPCLSAISVTRSTTRRSASAVASYLPLAI